MAFSRGLEPNTGERLKGLHQLQVCVDLSVLGGGFVDAATLRGLCHHTGGQLYLYEGFDPRLDSDQLLNDLRWNLMRPQVRVMLVLEATSLRCT